MKFDYLQAYDKSRNEMIRVFSVIAIKRTKAFELQILDLRTMQTEFPDQARMIYHQASNLREKLQVMKEKALKKINDDIENENQR